MEAQELWRKVKSAIEEIQRGRASFLRYEELYRLVLFIVITQLSCLKTMLCDVILLVIVIRWWSRSRRIFFTVND